MNLFGVTFKIFSWFTPGSRLPVCYLDKDDIIPKRKLFFQNVVKEGFGKYGVHTLPTNTSYIILFRYVAVDDIDQYTAFFLRYF